MKMRFKIQAVMEGDDGRTELAEIIELPTVRDRPGLSLDRSKSLLKQLQAIMVRAQASDYVDRHRSCPDCGDERRTKGYRSFQYRTPFGIVLIDTPRLHQCPCSGNGGTFSLLKGWCPDRVSPELLQLETKWSSLMAYGLTANLLKEVLPVGESTNGATLRNHLHRVARRMEDDVMDTPDNLGGCPREWAALPRPGKPIVLGIDGGYLRRWDKKKRNFEVIVGKSLASGNSKRFGFVQSHDSRPRRRLRHSLNAQGMQANQQITFLSDGADNLQTLQWAMYPESEHVLDWFHITMRLTVLKQFAKGMVHTDPEIAEQVKRNLDRTKWFLWHGNLERALDTLDDIMIHINDPDLRYDKRRKFVAKLEEFDTYISNNAGMIPNYGERWRNGERISTSFVESTINEVVAKRMVKKQQMQWSTLGAHLLLQTRTAVLNDDLQSHFERWYPSQPDGVQQPGLQRAA
jgi:hypothetical protein